MRVIGARPASTGTLVSRNWSASVARAGSPLIRPSPRMMRRFFSLSPFWGRAANVRVQSATFAHPRKASSLLQTRCSRRDISAGTAAGDTAKLDMRDSKDGAPRRLPSLLNPPSTRTLAPNDRRRSDPHHRSAARDPAPRSVASRTHRSASARRARCRHGIAPNTGRMASAPGRRATAHCHGRGHRGPAIRIRPSVPVTSQITTAAAFEEGENTAKSASVAVSAWSV